MPAGNSFSACLTVLFDLSLLGDLHSTACCCHCYRCCYFCLLYIVEGRELLSTPTAPKDSKKPAADPKKKTPTSAAAKQLAGKHLLSGEWC